MKLAVQKGEIVSIEIDSKPGVIHQCMVSDVDSEGRFSIVVQDSYSMYMSTYQLLDYMSQHDITQTMLAEILGVSKSTVSRLLKSNRRLPVEYVTKLGINTQVTNLQQMQLEYQLADLAALLTSALEKVKSLQGEKS